MGKASPQEGVLGYICYCFLPRAQGLGVVVWRIWGWGEVGRVCVSRMEVPLLALPHPWEMMGPTARSSICR